MSSHLDNLPMIETAKKGHWYPSIRNGYRIYRPYVREPDAVAHVCDCLRHAIMAAVKTAVIDDLKHRATRLAEDALTTGHIEFACDLDLRSNGMPVVCRFLNPTTEHSYTRRLSYMAAVKPFGPAITLGDAVDLKIVVQSKILSTPGITYLRHRRRRRKPRA